MGSGAPGQVEADLGALEWRRRGYGLWLPPFLACGAGRASLSCTSWRRSIGEIVPEHISATLESPNPDR